MVRSTKPRSGCARQWLATIAGNNAAYVWDARTGKLVWETDKVTALKHCATIHLTRNGDSVLLFTDQGNLIRARLDAAGYRELSRVHLIEPDYHFGDRKVVFAPLAFANRHVFSRNNEELICASLAAKP